MTLDQIKAAAKAGTLVGAFPDIPAEDYHSFTNYLSSTQIGAWIRSERHYAALLAGGLLDTASLAKGRLIHTAVGEMDKFRASIAMGPDVNRNTTIWKNFVAANPGKAHLKPDEVLEIMTIAANVHAHPTAGDLFRGALIEWSFFAICPITGMPVKCRADLLSPDYLTLADLKSTVSAHPNEFPKQAFALNYHIKMAHYMDVIEMAVGVRPTMGIFIAAETSPPFEVVPFVPDRDEEFTIDPLEVGALKARQVRAEISMRVKEKRMADAAGVPFRWKGYSDKFVPLCLPRHAAKAEAEAKGALV